MPSPTPRTGRSRALHARDAGLRRISIVTRAAIAASVVAAGAFAAVAAAAQPGRPKTATSNRPPGGGRATAVAFPPASSADQVPGTTPPTLAPDGNGDINPGDDGLAPPTTLPGPGYSPGPAVVSGAS